MHKSLQPKRGKSKGFLGFLILLLVGLGGWYFWKQRSEASFGEAAIDLKKYSEERPLMGTLAKITIFAESDKQAKTAFETAFSRGEAINQIASDYLPESELTQFNRVAPGSWHSASDDLLAMVAYGLEIADLTDGAFDPTLGTLTHLWRETKATKRLPANDTLEEARTAAGLEQIELDLDRKQIRKMQASLRLDLGGIGKGYAADEMLSAIESTGIRSALVLIGGDVRCSQAPPGEQGWCVGLHSIANELTSTITVQNCAVSTSGDLQQYVDIEGQRYSHILDPTSGLGLSDSLLATVVAPRGVMADSLATAACVNPVYFRSLLSSTDIHSRILSSKDAQISKGFPLQTPILEDPS